MDDTQGRLDRIKGRLQRLHLDRQIRQKTQSIAWMRRRLIQSTTHRFQQSAQHCQLLKQKLMTLDPEAVLRRGYSLVRQENGAVVRSAAELVPGQILNVQLAQGQVTVNVLDILEPHHAHPQQDSP